MCRNFVFVIALVVVLCVPAGVVRAQALVGYWNFDGNLNDAAGTNNGTFAGGQPAYVAGKVGQAISFDGVDDFVNIPSPVNPAVYSIAVWVKPARTDAAGIVTRTSGVGPTSEWSHQLRIQNGVFHHYLWVGAERNLPGTTSVSPDTWYHVVIVAQNSGSMRLYVNGKEDATSISTAGTLWGSGDRIYIGSNSGHGMGWFQGAVDDVRIYNRELTPAQISDLFNGSPPAFVKAENPDPADGATGVMTPLLQWSPGETALFHDVYLGTTPDLTEADLVGPRQPFTMYYHIMGLEPGVTYYWRVDEIEADMLTIHTGDLWSFTAMPVTAWAPSPAVGAEQVLLAPTLAWTAGQGAVGHHLYLGSDFDAVSGGAAETDMGEIAAGATSYQVATSLEMDTVYYWRVDGTDTAGAVVTGDVWSFTTITPGPGGAIRQWWTGVTGSTLDILKADARFPDEPSGEELVSLMEGPVDWSDNYASRIYGWLYAPASGDYTFWIATDDQGELWLSTDADPANATLIAGVEGWVPSRDFYGTAGVPGTRQQSAPVTLQAGQRYYIEALMNEGTGGDNIAVAWAGPGVPFGVIGSDVVAPTSVYPVKAFAPSPADGAVDTIQSLILSWSAGQGASQHAVYLGDDAEAVANADTSTADIFRGQQAATTYNTGPLEWGKTYYWRVDENTAPEAGRVWSFTTANFINVEDFESYDDADNRLYEIWVDGVVNGTGSYVGYDVANNGTFGETVIVHGGGQSMPIQYDNTVAPGISEADRTFTPAQNWTVEGVTTLVIHFRGDAANTGDLYVKINGTKVPYDGDPADIASRQWIAWEIDLASVGVNLASVTTLTIGIEGGGTGIVYVDDIWLTKP